MAYEHRAIWRLSKGTGHRKCAWRILACFTICLGSSQPWVAWFTLLVERKKTGAEESGAREKHKNISLDNFLRKNEYKFFGGREGVLSPKSSCNYNELCKGYLAVFVFIKPNNTELLNSLSFHISKITFRVMLKIWNLTQIP